MMRLEKRLLLVFYCAIVCNSASAQASDVGLVTLIRQALPPALASQRGETLQPINPALSLSGSSSIESQLERFDRVITDDKNNVISRPELILDQLKRLDTDIEVSGPKLTDAQKAEINEARKLLYGNSGGLLKTKEYERYLDFESKFSRLVQEQRSVSSVGERSILQLQMRNLEQDWESYGERSKFKRALEVTASSSQDKGKNLRTSWQQLLKQKSISDYSRFWLWYASSAEWIAVSFKPPLPAQPFQFSSEGTQNFIPSLAEVSFKFRIFRISRPALEHSFLRSGDWRNTKSYVLSDGSPTTTTSELVPRAVIALVIVKNVELTFNTLQAWESVNTSLSKNSLVMFSGLTLRTIEKSFTFSAPNYLNIGQPFIIAATVLDLPQVPSTNPSDSWPSWWQR